MQTIRSTNESGENYAINLKWGKQSTDNKGIPQIPSPSIFLTKDQLSKLGVKMGQHIVVCTIFNPGIRGGKVRNFLNVTGTLKHMNQLVVLN